MQGVDVAPLFSSAVHRDKGLTGILGPGWPDEKGTYTLHLARYAN